MLVLNYCVYVFFLLIKIKKENRGMRRKKYLYILVESCYFREDYGKICILIRFLIEVRVECGLGEKKYLV